MEYVVIAVVAALIAGFAFATWLANRRSKMLHGILTAQAADLRSRGRELADLRAFKQGIVDQRRNASAAAARARQERAREKAPVGKPENVTPISEGKPARKRKTA